MVLDLISTSYIGWPTPAFVSTKVQHFSCASKFYPSNWPDFQHKISEFARNVTNASQIRNFRPSKITFRQYRAGWECFDGLFDDNDR